MNFRSIIDRHFIKNPALRKKVTRLLEGDKDKAISLFGADLTINSVREHGYLRASRIAGWSSVFGDEAPVLLTLASMLAQFDTIVDAGANVGLYSTVLGRFQKLFGHLKIFAFEADPETFQRLQKNLSQPHMTAHNVALSNAPGKLSFIRGAVSHVTTTQDQANAYSLGDQFEVEARRLDTFDVPGQRIFIKIDVEGQELRVLQGAQRWFDEKRCAAVYLDGFENRDEVRAFLSAHDFTLLDGRTLEAANEQTFALLAVRQDVLQILKSPPA